MENSNATADQAPNTMNARFMSLIVAWYETDGRGVGASWSESCEFHTAVALRLYAGSGGALRLLSGGTSLRPPLLGLTLLGTPGDRTADPGALPAPHRAL